MLSAFAIVFTGSSVAYYNTKSFGFDEDAVFYERNEDGIVFLDKEIKFKDIDMVLDEAGKYMPKEMCTTKPYIGEQIIQLCHIMCI